MTERQRIQDEGLQREVGGQRPVTRPAVTRDVSTDVISTHDTGSTTVVTPTDRIRWGPIIAGLFTALSTLALLSVLGLAIGLSNADTGDRLRDFGLGAGIWGAISSLLAFALGGWMAANSAATRGKTNGLLNGAMVWLVAVPLMLYLLGGGLSALLGTAANVAGNVAGQAAAGAIDDPAVQATAQAAVPAIPPANQVIPDEVTPQTAAAADRAADAAWGTLLSLLLGLLAAALGGYLGARTEPDEHLYHSSPA